MDCYQFCYHPKQENPCNSLNYKGFLHLAERVGFEPTVVLPLRLISSQVHSTTLPPLLCVEACDYNQISTVHSHLTYFAAVLAPHSRK